MGEEFILCPECNVGSFNPPETSFHDSKNHAKTTTKSTKFASIEKDFSNSCSLQQCSIKNQGLNAGKTCDSVVELNKFLKMERVVNNHETI